MDSVCSNIPIKYQRHNTHAAIHIPQLQSITPIRQNDQPIMELPKIHNFSKSDLEIVNACRIYLQVNTLAEIADCQGTSILTCVLQGKMTENGQPLSYGIHQHQNSSVHNILYHPSCHGLSGNVSYSKIQNFTLR
jgi:hypothetical protein